VRRRQQPPSEHPSRVHEDRSTIPIFAKMPLRCVKQEISEHLRFNSGLLRTETCGRPDSTPMDFPPSLFTNLAIRAPAYVTGGTSFPRVFPGRIFSPPVRHTISRSARDLDTRPHRSFRPPLTVVLRLIVGGNSMWHPAIPCGTRIMSRPAALVCRLSTPEFASRSPECRAARASAIECGLNVAPEVRS
jgi:hypothetical protein